MNLRDFIASGDFQRSAPEIAMDLIFIANGTRFPPKYVKFGIPRVLDQRPDVKCDENTYLPIEVDEAYDDRFPGDNGFMYTRLSLAHRVSDDLVLQPLAHPFNTSALLGQINDALGTNIIAEEIHDEVHLTPGPLLTLRMKDSSLVWIGSTTFALNTTPVVVPENVRITSTGRYRVTSSGAYRVTAV